MNRSPRRNEFTAAIEDGGLVSAEARVHLARALFGLEREAEAELLLAGLTAERDTVSPRTCDLLGRAVHRAGRPEPGARLDDGRR